MGDGWAGGVSFQLGAFQFDQGRDLGSFETWAVYRLDATLKPSCVASFEFMNKCPTPEVCRRCHKACFYPIEVSTFGLCRDTTVSLSKRFQTSEPCGEMKAGLSGSGGVGVAFAWAVDHAKMGQVTPILGTISQRC